MQETCKRIAKRTLQAGLPVPRFVRPLIRALYRLGVNEVIPEEFETSVEIFTRVLTKYLVPKDEIARLVAEVRDDSYQMLRNISGAASMSVADLHLHLRDVEISPIFVPSGSPLAAKHWPSSTCATKLA